MVRRYHKLMVFGLWLGDMTLAAAAWGLIRFAHIAAARAGWFAPPAHAVGDLALPAGLTVVLATMIFGRLGLYGPKRTKNLIGEVFAVTRAVLLVWMITYVIAGLAAGRTPSRATMGAALGAWLPLAALWRLVARAFLRWCRSQGRNLRYAAIVGTGRLAQRLYHSLQKNAWTGIQASYFVRGSGKPDKLMGLDVLGPLDEIDALLKARPVDIVFVALPGSMQEKIENVLSRLAMTHFDVRLVPDLLHYHFLRHEVTQLDELPVVTLTHSPQHGWNSAMKRASDIVGSIFGLVLFAVPMAVIASVIKSTSRGPALYFQKRSSLAGKTFTMIKFRTMVENAEAGTGPVWAAEDDSRVTWIGRFLRRTSLDELPQFFNVLAGQMSLVGPRPERPEMVERFSQHVPRYMLRHQVKAGMTGWAQVNGLRGNTPLRKRIQYDLHYVSNWSFGFDLWILALSPIRFFARRGPR